VPDKHTHHMLPGADPDRRKSLWAQYSFRILPIPLRKAAAAGGAGGGRGTTHLIASGQTRGKSYESDGSL
jgi:hypothetical protein